MSFTYGNPAAKKKDAVRLTIGDTRAAEAYLQDHEIEYYLGLTGQNVLSASISCCQAIIARLAREVDESAGQLSLSSSQAMKNYASLAKTLELKLATSGQAVPYSGGISLLDIRNTRGDSDWNRPDFSLDMMRSPFVSRYLGLPDGGVWDNYLGPDVGK